MSRINYESYSPNDDADAIEIYNELAEQNRRRQLSELLEDANPLAILTLRDEGEEITVSVSDCQKAKKCDKFLQLSTDSLVGHFIAENRHHLEVGTKLPNDSVVVKIGYIRPDNN